MSGKVVGWAMEQATGSPTTKLVLVKLADNAGEDGLCWPSIEKIVQHTELGQSTVYKHLAALEALGLISAMDVERGPNTVRGYQLHIAGSIPPRRNHDVTIPPRGKPSPADGKRLPSRGKTIPPGGMLYKDEPSVEPSIEPTLEPDARERAVGVGEASPVRKQKYSDAFDRVWVEVRKWPEFTNIWSKPSVWTEWQRAEAAGDLLSPGDMVAATREYGRERTRLNAEAVRDRKTPQHTKHPANFLRDRVFLGIHEALQESAAAGKAQPPRPISITAEDVAKLRSAGLSDDVVAQWFADGEFDTGPPPAFRAATPFKATWISQRYASVLERAFGSPVIVTVKQERAA